jgi:DNA (cytosine-5)-methyltransferase 1
MRMLDLFSGIGGFSLGLERAGMQTVAFCECEPYPRAVLAKHWPNVPCYDDVRTLTADRLAADGITVDVICGGFPCQDISTAGKGAGLAGERSGLWREYARLVGEIRPRYVVVENVSALLSRGLGTVLGDLAQVGYDAEWHCIPAAYVGAPHRRDRVWIVAYPNGAPTQRGGVSGGVYAEHANTHGRSAYENELADSKCGGSPRQGGGNDSCDSATQGEGEAIEPFNGRFRDFWRVEPSVGRVANGVPKRMDRLKALGNAVVPQVVELIGRAIMNQDRIGVTGDK